MNTRQPIDVDRHSTFPNSERSPVSQTSSTSVAEATADAPGAGGKGVVKHVSGYFASVQASIDPDPEQATEAPVHIRVIEGRTRSVSGGIGYSESQKLLLNGSIVHTNFLGTGNRVALEVFQTAAKNCPERAIVIDE